MRPSAQALAALALALAPAPSRASGDGMELVLSLGAGVYVPTQDNGFSSYDPVMGMPALAVDTLGPGVDLEVALSAWWGLFGAQLGFGYLTASHEQTSVGALSVTALLRIRFPVGPFAPYLEGGGGVCFTSATTPAWVVQGTSANLEMASFGATALEWIAGAGADLDVGSVRFGASLRYLWVDQTPLSATASVPLRDATGMRFALDGFAATASVGYLFPLGAD